MVERVLRAHLLASTQTIILRKLVLNHMARYRQSRWWKLEAGGQLFGCLEDDALVVNLATGPYRGDLRTRFGYRSKPDRAQREILSQRAQGLYYCGDWHTHPESHPTASGEDLGTVSKMMNRSDLRMSTIVMVIQGTALEAQGVALYTSDGDSPIRWMIADDLLEIT